MIAFGTQGLSGDAGVGIIQLAAASGCRTFDTALAYGNQTLLGAALRGCDEVRLVSKVTRQHIAQLSLRGALERVLRELEVEAVDTLLVHAPKGVPHADVYGEMLTLRREGKLRRCGFSNYTERHLRQLERVGVTPEVLQVEVHPYLPEHELLAYCSERKIEVMGHSAFAAGQIFRDDGLAALARSLGCSVASLVLAWSRRRGVLPVVSSTRPAHVQEVSAAVLPELSPCVMSAMRQLECGRRLCNDPQWAEFTAPTAQEPLAGAWCLPSADRRQ